MAIVAAYCYQDIIEHVDSLCGRSSAKPTPKFVLQLCNQALREIAVETKPMKKVWTGNASAGDSNIAAVNTSSKVYSFLKPIDLIRIIRIDYTNGTIPYTLESWTHDALDAVSPGWQDSSVQTGVPTRYCVDGDVIELNVPIAIDDVAKITVQGYCHLPTMTAAETVSTTPLRYLPVAYQLSLAWYVLSELPVDVESKQAALQQARYTAKWEQARRSIIESLAGMDVMWANGA